MVSSTFGSLLKKVVVVDDNPGDRELSLIALRREFGQFEVEQPLDNEAFVRCLEGKPATLVITDYQLCWTNGLRILRDIKQAWPQSCVIMVTGTGSEEVAVEAMKLGLDDYVIKTEQHRARLVPAVLGAMEARRQRAALEEARAESERMLGIIDAATDIIWTADPRGNIEFLNRAGMRLLGYSEGRPIAGTSIFSIHGEGDQDALRAGLETARTSGIWNGEIALRPQVGDYVPVSIALVAHSKVKGSVAYYSAIARDIRGWKSLEEQLRQSQKMDAVGQLAGGVAHDFNNNLTVILAGLQMVLRPDAALPEWQTEAIQAAMKAAEHSVGLTRRLLSFSRRDTSKVEAIDLTRVVSELTKMLRRVVRENITLRVSHPEEPVWIYADSGLMEQAIMNLVVNARDAIAASGKLTIEVETTSQTPAGKETAVECAILRVRDTGCGMPPEVRKRIFEPFFTTKEKDKGTGLGLATVYTIVQQHGGRIDVESEVGVGTCFTVTLPLCEPSSKLAVGHPPSAQLDGGSETILLVEDDRRVVALIETALTRMGYRILQAGSAAEARALWDTNKQSINFVLSDAVLPGDESGLDLLRAICEGDGRIEVVLMSGYHTDAIKTFVASEKRATFLEKPFTLDELVHLVRERLDRTAAK